MFKKVAVGEPKEVIIREWCAKFDPAFDSDDFAGNISSRRFRNPSAFHVDGAAREVVEFVLSGEKGEGFDSKLNDLCQLVALWNSSPSETLKPFTQLRSLVASNLGDFDANSEEAQNINSRIDEVVLSAFEDYVLSREKLNSIRFNELKRKTDALERVFNNAQKEMGEF